MNSFGLFSGLVTLLIIGLGFPLVIHGERIFGVLCWPYMLAAGLLLCVLSVLIQNDWLCMLTGVLGATFAWGSTELKEQSVRVKLGWYPDNPVKLRLPFADTISKWKAPHL